MHIYVIRENMKYLAVILILYLVLNSGYAQEIEDILNSRQFVLEASKITAKSGNLGPSSRKLCFIMIDSSKIVVQWIANCDNNGLGGMTIKGDITNFNISRSEIKKETLHVVNLDCTLDEGRVKSNITMDIFTANHAEATLKNVTTSIFVPELMNFKGSITPLELSNIQIGSD